MVRDLERLPRPPGTRIVARSREVTGPVGSGGYTHYTAEITLDTDRSVEELRHFYRGVKIPGALHALPWDGCRPLPVEVVPGDGIPERGRQPIVLRAYDLAQDFLWGQSQRFDERI